LYWYWHTAYANTGTGMPVPVRSHLLGARSSIVILLLTMPVPVQVQAFWQCPYRYWHFCQLCQYQYGHFTYANTGIGIFLMPIQVLASFFQQCQYQYRHFGNAHTGTGIFANRANTSTGIFPMPILVLIFSQCLYRYWHLQCDARTGNFYFCQSCQYQYGHFQYQYGHFLHTNTSIGIVFHSANTSMIIYQLTVLIISTTFLYLSPQWQTRSDLPMPRHAPNHMTSGTE
jgi:hypothetical protein